MRKTISILLALAISAVMILTATAPVMAEPGDNQPVAWVNFTGTGSGGLGNPHDMGMRLLPNVQINVKRLADGSTVGHMELRFLKYDYDISFDVIDSSFGTNGETKYANILATGPQAFPWWQPGTYYYLWHIEDNGEPGGGNDYFAVWLYSSVEPVFGYETIAPDNIQVHITDAYVP